MAGFQDLASSRRWAAWEPGPAGRTISGTPCARARQGADVIKIFASASIRDGGTPSLSAEQLEAACGEARAAGLRTVVHAYDPESVRRVLRAGCTTVEHGALLDRETLQLMADRGAYFDPNLDLVFRNYLENKPRFLGIGNYTEAGFAAMEEAIPSVLAVFREAAGWVLVTAACSDGSPVNNIQLGASGVSQE